MRSPLCLAAHLYLLPASDDYEGYEFMWADMESYDFGVKIYWNKIPILQEAFQRFPKAQWVWWLDLDAIIMNPALDLHSHLLSSEGMERQLVRDEVLRQPGGDNSSFRTPAAMDFADVDFIIDAGVWGMSA